MKTYRQFSPISSITSGPRLSNIELLRILAMLLVLVVHADFWALGEPLASDFFTSSCNAVFRTMIQSSSIVCVNVFILISGWFGIRFSLKGLSSFIFQCAYFIIGIYIATLLAGETAFSINGIAQCLCLTKAYWFIKAYLGLYILSPVLNTYVGNSSERLQKTVLISFFIFQTAYGWSNAAVFIKSGYSTFSFIGLYILANYVRYHHIDFIARYGGPIFIMTVIINTCLYIFVTLNHLHLSIYSYANPFVIIGALGLLGLFLRINIKSNRLINWIATSAFAVYLLHTNTNLFVPTFKPIILSLYESYSGISCIGMILGFLLLTFLIAVLLDQPRKCLWTLLSKSVFQ